VLVELVDGLWPLWDAQNRAIHDMLAATRVVRADIPRAAPDTSGATASSR